MYLVYHQLDQSPSGHLVKIADAGLKDYVRAYRHRFTYLHTPPNEPTGQQPPAHHAPNKPLFLLTLIDLFAQGLITANWIEPVGQWLR